MTKIVNNVLDWKWSLPGPSLAVNDLTLLVCPSDGNPACNSQLPYVGRDNTQYYDTYITTYNDIPVGGLIRVTWPSGIFTLRQNSCRILSGLANEGYTEDEQVLCTVDVASNHITITKFSYFKAGSISFRVFATNPSTAGVKSPFFAYTYYDTGLVNMID